jgi:hypothetical protein
MVFEGDSGLINAKILRGYHFPLFGNRSAVHFANARDESMRRRVKLACTPPRTLAMKVRWRLPQKFADML